MDNNIKFSMSRGFRVPAQEKSYWLGQLQRFANQFASMQVLAVQYGKQDTRGVPSITLVDYNHCVPKQVFFPNNQALLYYVQGYNEAQGNSNYNPFAPYMKGAK